MAQNTGGSDFDLFWEEKSSAAWRLLREAADVWAQDGRAGLDVRLAVDRFMHILASPGRGLWPQVRWPKRFLLEPVPPGTTESCATLAPSCSEARTADAERALLATLSSAADEWSMGHPEEPSTRGVLHEMLTTLWQFKIAPHPPSKAYPREM